MSMSQDWSKDPGHTMLPEPGFVGRAPQNPTASIAQVRSQQSVTVQSEPGQGVGVTFGLELIGHDETPLPAEKHVSLNRLQQVSKLHPVKQRVSPGFGSTRQPDCAVHWKLELAHVKG